MNLMRWEPFRETEDFLRNLSTPMFGRWPQLLGEEAAMRIEWSPAVDIKETEAEYLVNAELPGVKKEDFKISLDEGVLTIEGERRQEKEIKGERTHRVERFYGKFCRSFTLPEYADANAIRAEYLNGVLSVHVPKLKVEKRQALEIEADRMQQLLLDQAEFEAEKQVVLEELSQGEDDPWRVLSQEVQAAVFPRHPYQRPVIGFTETLKALSVDEMRAYYRRFYHPGNAPRPALIADDR